MLNTLADNSQSSGTAPVASGLLLERKGAIVVATLNRPAKLNAIDSGIKAALATEIPRIARDPQVYAVLLKASPGRMFSAGGDIREMYSLLQTNPLEALAECAREYALIWLLECFSKPTAALVDGPVLGTGAGIVLTHTHRVAAAGYRFQMPETAIGYFPDNGVAWHLARMPHQIGVWLGLTGSALEPADAFGLGLTTHCINADHFDEIAAALADAQPIDTVLDALHVDPGPAPLAALAATIERCFSANSIAEIMARLAEASLTGEREHRSWCETTAATLAERSPTALEVTLQLIRRAGQLDIRQTLTLEYRLARHLMPANDFLEGVRARVIEKGIPGKSGAPRWRPAALSDVGLRQIDRLFEPLPEGELILPTREEMQAARV